MRILFFILIATPLFADTEEYVKKNFCYLSVPFDCHIQERIGPKILGLVCYASIIRRHAALQTLTDIKSTGQAFLTYRIGPMNTGFKYLGHKVMMLDNGFEEDVDFWNECIPER